MLLPPRATHGLQPAAHCCLGEGAAVSPLLNHHPTRHSLAYVSLEGGMRGVHTFDAKGKQQTSNKQRQLLSEASWAAWLRQCPQRRSRLTCPTSPTFNPTSLTRHHPYSLQCLTNPAHTKPNEDFDVHFSACHYIQYYNPAICTGQNDFAPDATEELLHSHGIRSLPPPLPSIRGTNWCNPACRQRTPPTSPPNSNYLLIRYRGWQASFSCNNMCTFWGKAHHKTPWKTYSTTTELKTHQEKILPQKRARQRRRWKKQRRITF